MLKRNNMPVEEKRVEGEAEEVMISVKELKKAKAYLKKRKPATRKKPK